MAIQLAATLHQLALLAPLDLTTIEQNVNVTYVLSPNQKGWVARRPGFLSNVPNVVQPSAAGEPLQVLVLDVNTAFSLPDGIVAVTPGTVTDPTPALTNLTATAL